MMKAAKGKPARKRGALDGIGKPIPPTSPGKAPAKQKGKLLPPS
jgi:hypothetical protein